MSAETGAEIVPPTFDREPAVPLSVVLDATDVGRFAAIVELPERGNWDLDIVVERDGERYALTRRMFLR